MLSLRLLNLLGELLLKNFFSKQKLCVLSLQCFRYLSFVVGCYPSFIVCTLNYLYVVEFKIKLN